jgi:hypothetical protein
MERTGEGSCSRLQPELPHGFCCSHLQQLTGHGLLDRMRQSHPAEPCLDGSGRSYMTRRFTGIGHQVGVLAMAFSISGTCWPATTSTRYSLSSPRSSAERLHVEDKQEMTLQELREQTTVEPVWRPRNRRRYAIPAPVRLSRPADRTGGGRYRTARSRAESLRS